MTRVQLSDVQVGDCFKREDRWWIVHQVFGNVKKGSETAQSKIVLQDALSGAKKEVRIKSAEKVDTVEMTMVACEVVRMDKGGVVVRQKEEGEEASEEELVVQSEGHLVHYLKPGMKVTQRSLAIRQEMCVGSFTTDAFVGQVLVRMLDEMPLRVEPPKHVQLKVKSIPEMSDQVAETKRVAVLENGRKIKVPAHIEKGQEIVVRPSDESYVGLADETAADSE